uniref:Little elongation complex subunit 2 C-terminal domain-containing protein n=1 Tax=Glossina brevipalpis TaxID=37001 RepID=A0A1A9WPC2_9MUSC
MDNFYGNYQPNAIFRNQPNYTYFNKSLGEKDNLYLTLNEIDDYFLHPEQKLNRKGFEYESILDPRNKKEVIKFYYDHVKRRKPYIFRSNSSSAMNRYAHTLGVRIIKTLQDGEYINEEDFCKWESLKSVRTKEQAEFQKFVFEYQGKNKEEFYSPTKKLSKLYKDWYDEKTKMLRTRISARPYNTHVGLPHIRVCKSFLTDQISEISEPIVISHKGFVRRDNNNEEVLNYKILARHIEKYALDYKNSLEEENQIDISLQNDFLNKLKNEETPLHTFYIPIETIMFLLTAGDYIDLPTEVLFEIKSQRDPDMENNRKLIIMEEPLPSRICGWHTCRKVVEQAALALSSVEKPQTLHLECKSISEEKITQNTLSNSFEYKLIDIETYMSSCKFKKNNNTCKFSKILIKWILKTDDENENNNLGIYTPMTSQNGQCEEPLHMTTIKMEYKTRFGCEILTKYEMLYEWFRLKLLKHSPMIICHRLDINSYETVAQEKLTLERLENSLHIRYNLNVNQLLNNLNEFLKLLLNMPDNSYMLRYNTKFKDKLILCHPSEEITQNTIYLHHLLQENPTDLAFISQMNYLPIADDVCNLMHLEYKLIPCGFRPLPSTLARTQQKVFKKSIKPLNDRDMILKKVSKQKDIQLREKRIRKRRNKIQKKKEKKRLKINEQEKQKSELQKEIENDQTFFVN